MQCAAVAPKATAVRVPLRLVEGKERPRAAHALPPLPAASSIPCFTDANFCRCWMPAWFQLAEMVAQERHAAEP